MTFLAPVSPGQAKQSALAHAVNARFVLTQLAYPPLEFQLV